MQCTTRHLWPVVQCRHHEDMSVKMLDAALSHNGKHDAFYTNDNRRKITDMILASKDKTQVHGPL